MQMKRKEQMQEKEKRKNKNKKTPQNQPLETSRQQRSEFPNQEE